MFCLLLFPVDAGASHQYMLQYIFWNLSLPDSESLLYESG